MESPRPKLGRWIHSSGRTIRRWLILDALVFAVVFSFTAQICLFSAASQQSFAGVVYGANGPVVGAVVDASGTGGSGSAVTDSSGHYTISEGLGTDTHNLTVFALGYLKGETDNVNVTVGQTTQGTDFDLQLSGEISETVTDAVDGTPLSGINVVVSWDPYTGTYGYSATTDSNGRYLLATDLPNVSYVVTALRPEGHLSKSSSTQEVTAGAEVKNVNFRLPRSGIISGTVVAHLGGEPLCGTYVLAFVYSQDLAPVGFATTNSAGQFRITTGLDTGEYTVTAGISGWPGFMQTTVMVTAGQESSVDLEIQINGIGWAIITGYLTDKTSGKPIANVNVTATGNLGSSGSAKTDSSGTFEIYDLGTDTYNVTTAAPGYQDQTAVGINATVNTLPANVNLQMRKTPASRSGAITGTVTGAPNPVPEFQYTVIVAFSLTLIAATAGRRFLRTKRVHALLPNSQVWFGVKFYPKPRRLRFQPSALTRTLTHTQRARSTNVTQYSYFNAYL